MMPPNVRRAVSFRTVGVLLLTLLLAPFLSGVGAQSIFERANATTVRLEPSRFPALPATVRQDLERRGCRIPQGSSMFVTSPQPHNVVQGAFTGVGWREWAALCSVRDTSIILVYRDGAATASDSLGRLPDIGFQQGTGDGNAAFSRVISAISAVQIRQLHARLEKVPNFVALPAGAEHDGISDAFAGKGSSILFFHQGRWLILAGAD
jgi:hypothetical protein